MSVERKALDGFGAGWMVVLCVILGLHQVAIKAAAHDMAPILQIGLRSGISAVLVALVILFGKQRTDLRGTLIPGILAGTLFSVEFCLIAEGLRFTSASHMSVFLYTAPVFTSFLLHWLQPSERLRTVQWLGILLAFAGIALAFAGGLFSGGFTAQVLLGDTLALLAGFLWAATTVLVRCSKLAGTPPTWTLLYQLVAAFFVLICYAFFSGQARHYALTSLSVGSVLFQGVVVSFAVYLAWFWMLRRYNVSQLSAFLFLSPLFGVSFGVLLLHESMDQFFVVGAVLVLMGITLVTRNPKAKAEEATAYESLALDPSEP